MREFTAEEDDILRANSRKAAALLLGITYYEAKRRQMFLRDPDCWKKQAERNARNRPYIPSTHGPQGRHTKPCPIALADRDRRMDIEHPTMTAMLMGDPLPGQSALDRR